MTDRDKTKQAIAAQKFHDEAQLIQQLLSRPPYDASTAENIQRNAAAIITAARSKTADKSLLDTFLSEYGLSNNEGVILMCLAESLLRIPDQRTAERLIADKIELGNWAAHAGQADSLLVNASTWALMLSGKLVAVDREFTDAPGNWLRWLSSRLGEPVIESAMRGAMRILGREFVLGTTIDNAIDNADNGQLYSFDMLGEAAREANTAARYFESYQNAIRAIGKRSVPNEHGRQAVSIKLSALHPRYEPTQRARVMNELLPVLKALCLDAAQRNIDLTVDAEEADRLSISLDIFARVAEDPDLDDLRGLGLAVQAYGKRAVPILDWLVALARKTGRHIPVRLVKGAYWDAEIKHAQVLGLPGFSVFTRKPSTDLSFLVCARKILDHPDELHGKFATHNAHSLAAIVAMAKRNQNYEFQRLHGMGDSLYRAARAHYPSLPPVRTYAPVGMHRDLLAYLVRRLLENGANSSFANRFLDERMTPEELARDPIELVRQTSPAAHPKIRLPKDLFGSARRNSAGLDLADQQVVNALVSVVEASESQRFEIHNAAQAADNARETINIVNPAKVDERLGRYCPSSRDDIDAAFAAASQAQPAWDARGGGARARVLEAFADQLELARERFIVYLCREAGKTYPDAIAEVREAVDFCRYYALQAREKFESPIHLPGPTGESNELSLHGRGVFACISPWNFPLAIFIGQIAAALAAGNAVVAKPAEETPFIADQAIQLLYKCGLPETLCHLVLGAGEVGARVVRHPLTAGVAFTGGTSTAQAINSALAARQGPITPLIAETGGQNAIIADSTALLEQVTDDVIQSAFLSAGQRCSALRVLFLQEEIADTAIAMIKGAMNELRVGDPARPETDVGPIISASALKTLEAHVAELKGRACPVHQSPLTAECANGHFLAPSLTEIDSISQLKQEHFGPIVHVIRFAGEDFESVLQEIAGTGFGLTFGIHSRIGSRVEEAWQTLPVGNIYANRNITGAVVGSQPFGGQRLSGTGPKAGGPNYLLRFATEKSLTVNTVATGGNTELLGL